MVTDMDTQIMFTVIYGHRSLISDKNLQITYVCHDFSDQQSQICTVCHVVSDL